MKIHQIGLLLLIFSASMVFFNTTGVFYIYMDDPGLTNKTAMEQQMEGIYEIPANDSAAGKMDTQSGLDLVDLAGGTLTIFWNMANTTIHLGSIVEESIGGTVGHEFRILIDTITLFVILWGGFQIVRKFSSKGVD